MFKHLQTTKHSFGNTRFRMSNAPYSIQNSAPRLRHRVTRHLEMWVRVAPAVGAFAALLSVYVAASQIHNETKHLHEQARVSAKQDQLQRTLLDLQEQLVQQTGEATRASLVAQVKMVKAKLGPFKGSFVPKEEIKNEGKTSALLTSDVQAVFFTSQQSPESLAFEKASVVKPDQSLAIIGSELMHATPEIKLNGMKESLKTRSELKQHLASDYLYVWGTLLYRDVFQQQHLSKFCYSHLRGEPSNEVYACPFLNTLNEEVGIDAVYVIPTSTGFKLEK